MMRRKGKWILAMTTILVSSLGTAQTTYGQANVPGQNAAGAPARDRAQDANSLDGFFAACLILENQNEIDAARLAAQRSKNPEVKKFAEMMIADHESFIKQLEQTAGQPAPQRSSRDGAAPDARNPARNNPDANVTTNKADERRDAVPAAGAPGQKPRTDTAVPGHATAALLQIKKEIADECLASVRRELDGKQGHEFDACYVGMQMAAHMKMVDELKVLQKYGSPQLNSTMKKGHQTAQMHLDHARKIMKILDDGEKTAAKDRQSEAK